MADVMENELVVIGGGPGGYAAAFLAADKGMKVTLIDEGAKPGGTCLHIGCIPSKALLHAAKIIFDARDGAKWGIEYGQPKVNVDVLRKHWFEIVDNLAKNLLELCKRRNVEYVSSRAKLVDRQTLELADGSRRRFQHCILAVGSSPTRIPSLHLESDRVMDSAAALRLPDLPKSFLVVGGGYIGLELGTVYAALGSKVTVVELTGGLLPGVDRDLVRPLQGYLNTLFDKILLNTKVNKLTETKKGIQATLEGEELQEREPVFDRVLIAVGRRPNSKGIGLEEAGVKINDKGFAEVDRQLRTSNERVFAIGDVAGEPMLAHKASHEAKVAVEVIAGEPAVFDSRAIPAVVFTDPEIAWCGLTETEAKRDKIEIKVARFPWAASGRAATLDRTEGLTKLVLDPESERVLGVGIVGTGAGELISEGVLAVEMAATAQDLSLSIHPHPTLSETIGEAAEVLHGTATHLYRARK